MKTLSILFLCAILQGGSSLAQDSIIFISGRVIEGKVKEIDSLDILFDIQKKKKVKLIYVAKSSVFAIKYGEGETDIFYKPLSSEEYSIREMEFFIRGEQDAMKHVRAPILFYGGILVGGASMFYLGPFYGLLPLVPYSLLGGIANSKIKETATSNPALLREDTYLTGYVTKAKSMKIQKAITGSFIGYVAGLFAIAIVAQNEKD